MLRIVFFIAFFISGWVLFGQIEKGFPTTNGRMLNDTINNSGGKKIITEGKTKYIDYKIISYRKDTTIVDTTLSIIKEKVFNFIRKNTLELNPLHNMGQPFNRLTYDSYGIDLLPEMGMRAKYYNYFPYKSVDYYKVPTPTSELFFQTGIQQGHVLNSLFTTNINPQLNFSVAYKGLRSLGNYRNTLASHQNLRMTISYNTLSKKYFLRSHYAGQNIYNQENGGLTDESLILYFSDNLGYKERERLETNFTDAESRLKTRHYYIENVYNLWRREDTVKNKESYLQFGHELLHERKFYTYHQDKANAFFGEAYDDEINDSTYYFRTVQTFFTKLKSPVVMGSLRLNMKYTEDNYGYRTYLYLDEDQIPAQLKHKDFLFTANWKTSTKKFELQFEAGKIFKGDHQGSFLTGFLEYKKDSIFNSGVKVSVLSASPNYNTLLYQSNYVDFNWYKILENEYTRHLNFYFHSPKWIDLEAHVTQKDFYTYFDENAKPNQLGEGLFYFKTKIHKELGYRKFSLDASVIYQKVLQGSEVLHLPDLISEGSFYYSNLIFKRKPLYLQTGFTVKYFTKYFADEYNPLINEFQLQNVREVGNYPMIDYFVNGRVQRTRLFFKFENLESLINGGKYLVTPTQPYRDFSIRFGLVWNFFI